MGKNGGTMEWVMGPEKVMVTLSDFFKGNMGLLGSCHPPLPTTMNALRYKCHRDQKLFFNLTLCPLTRHCSWEMPKICICNMDNWTGGTFILGGTHLFIPLFHREVMWLWQGVKWSSELQLGVFGIQLRVFPSKCEV
jgi:hypothetical protein